MIENIPYEKEPSVSIITDEKDLTATKSLELYINFLKETGRITTDGFKYIVAMENSVENIAIDTIDKTTRVVIFSGHTELYLPQIVKWHPAVGILLQNHPENIRVIPIDRIGDLTKSGANTFFEQEQTLDIVLSNNLLRYFSRELATLIHDARKFQHIVFDEESSATFEYCIAERFREKMPGFNTASHKEIIEYLLAIDNAEDQDSILSKEYLPGVYCDIEGTLITSKNILCKEVFLKLKDYESKGYTITLWTGGNTEDLRSVIQNLGITYPLVSKYDYRGAKAEIVIDDMVADEFYKTYAILPENYIRV